MGTGFHGTVDGQIYAKNVNLFNHKHSQILVVMRPTMKLLFRCHGIEPHSFIQIHPETLQPFRYLDYSEDGPYFQIEGGPNDIVTVDEEEEKMKNEVLTFDDLLEEKEDEDAILEGKDQREEDKKLADAKKDEVGYLALKEAIERRKRMREEEVERAKQAVIDAQKQKEELAKTRMLEPAEAPTQLCKLNELQIVQKDVSFIEEERLRRKQPEGDTVNKQNDNDTATNDANNTNTKQEEKKEDSNDGNDTAAGGPQEVVLDHEFVYQSDFDANGLCYALGSNYGKTSWSNPAESPLELVKVTPSQKKQDSKPYKAVVGRQTVRCLTEEGKDEDGKRPWILIDFSGSGKISPTHYTLRHYISWNVEALRDWVLEASNDGKEWTLIKEHKNDTALNAKGKAHTWKLNEEKQHPQFSMFRIRMTDKNDNGHWYLACSGFEIYGKFTQNADLQLDGGGGDVEDQKAFEYASDFDKNGIIYWLGTDYGKNQQWKNPADPAMNLNLVTVKVCKKKADSQPPHCFIGRTTVRCLSDEQQNAWFSVDFQDRYIKPTLYSLRHYTSWKIEALRSWEFQGSVDGQNWITLKKHENDTSLNDKGKTKTWNVDCNEWYSHFRVRMLDKNDNGHWYLCCSGFEIYGHLKYRKPTPLDIPPFKTYLYDHDFDENGIVYAFGTSFGKEKKWTNPYTKGVLGLSSSGMKSDGEPIHKLIGRTGGVRCLCDEKPNAWWYIDFRDVRVRPTHYTLRHYVSWNIEALRHWKFEGFVTSHVYLLCSMLSCHLSLSEVTEVVN